MALLQECIGARGFESDTYFEMALRDALLIPSLEGSMHINLGLAAGFIPRYFDRNDSSIGEPLSLIAGEVVSRENAYLMEARTGAIHSIAFRPYLDAYRDLMAFPNVTSFTRQVDAFRDVTRRIKVQSNDPTDSKVTMIVGQCFATIAFGQLVAENLTRLEMQREMTSAIFHGLVEDLSSLALQLAALPHFDEATRDRIRQMLEIPRTRPSDWDFFDRGSV
jgi:acyl-CoA dehydrogenase